MKHRIAILASGRGSNMLALSKAISDGHIPASIELVLSDVPDAPALERAAARGHEALHIPAGPSTHRLSGEAEQLYIEALRSRAITLVCLAGFMRILKAGFLEAFPDRILNIHPSLLPAFPGLDAIGQALEHGVQVTGVTVHFVNGTVDGGPIVLQRAVEVEPADDHASLAEKIHAAEHDLFPRAVGLFCLNQLRLEGRRVRIVP